MDGLTFSVRRTSSLGISFWCLPNAHPQTTRSLAVLHQWPGVRGLTDDHLDRNRFGKSLRRVNIRGQPSAIADTHTGDQNRPVISANAAGKEPATKQSCNHHQRSDNGKDQRWIGQPRRAVWVIPIIAKQRHGLQTDTYRTFCVRGRGQEDRHINEERPTERQGSIGSCH